MKYLIVNSNSILNQTLKSNFVSDNFHFIENKHELNLDLLNAIKPNFIFFPHWSYIISEEIFNSYRCVVFHMTDLPFGRGGSPLQNLISREISHTKISALKVVKDIDSGPIYLKKDLCLNGSAEEIFLRAGKIIVDMIWEIIKFDPSPTEQNGEAVFFKRRGPEMSDIFYVKDLNQLFNHIRMLDAEFYPKAFIENDNFRFEFSRASLKSDNSIIADVRIFKK